MPLLIFPRPHWAFSLSYFHLFAGRSKPKQSGCVGKRFPINRATLFRQCQGGVESSVLFALLVLGISAVVLTVILWIVTLFFQGYFYTEPTSQILWQAPAAGAALGLFYAFWCLLVVNGTTGDAVPYDTLFRFTPRVEKFDKPVPKLLGYLRGEKTLYKRKADAAYDVTTQRGSRRYVFEDERGRPYPPNRFESIVVIDDEGNEIRFEAQPPSFESSYRSFRTQDGWVIREYHDGITGRPEKFRWGLFLANVMLNIMHFAVWFLCLWLLLRFFWGHALGFALIAWLAATLTVLPMILAEAADVGRERNAETEQKAMITFPRECA